MPYDHPHVKASYRILTQKDMTFAVEVPVPETFPTMISSFSTKAEAEQWIAKHQAQVAKGTIFRRTFNRPMRTSR